MILTLCMDLRVLLLHFSLCTSMPNLIFFILLQLLLNIAVNGLSISATGASCQLPSATSVINLADSHDRTAFDIAFKMKEEPMDVVSLDNNKEDEEIDIELSGDSSESLPKEVPKRDGPQDPKQDLQLRLQQEAKFLETCREVKVSMCT